MEHRLRPGLRRSAPFILSALLLASLPGEAWAQATIPNHVREVRVHDAPGLPGATEIEVVGTVSPSYSVRLAGKQLLIDLNNADLAGHPEAVNGVRGVVGGVLTQSFKGGAGNMTRLSVNLARAATYRVRADGTTLKITLTPDEPTASMARGAAATPVESGVLVHTAGADDAPAPSSLKAKGGAEQGTSVDDVHFERVPRSNTCPNGCDRVTVSPSQVPAYALTTTPAGRVRLELKKTSVPEKLQRTLDVTQYRGVLKNVSTFADAESGSVIVEIERLPGETGGSSTGNVVVEGGKLVWSFELPKPAGATRRTTTMSAEEPAPKVARIETSIRETSGGDPEIKVETIDGASAGFTSTVNAQAAGGQGRFNGRRIDLDLKDADIHNVLRLLADVGRVNIVTADDVAGNITIRMRNVPWDQALDVVLQAKGLGMVRSGNLIRVAPMAQLQKERELKLAQQKQELDLAPLETRLIPVSYAQADELQARAKDFLSPRGSLAVDERTNVLIARDVSGNLNRIEELVRSLDTQTPQVLVEARIVEATSRYLRDVGIQWGGDTIFSEATGNPTGVAFPSRVGIAGGNYDPQTPTAGLSPFQRQVPNPNFAVNLPAATGTGAGGALGLTFGSIDNTVNLGVRLSAAESSGMVRIVSSPRILTLDNREARINQGTLIPFAQVSAQGVQTTFQEAKLQLLVRPHVTADGSVSMHVKINRDEPDFNQTSARGDPTILKREAETDLLVMDGHTAVIGGIFTRNTGRNLDQVPFFGDIPILGVLFQRRRASDTRNELVIFLTPRIVNRAEALGR
jgi:type IV pilus assembly protein PilQ